MVPSECGMDTPRQARGALGAPGYSKLACLIFLLGHGFTRVHVCLLYCRHSAKGYKDIIEDPVTGMPNRA